MKKNIKEIPLIEEVEYGDKWIPTMEQETINAKLCAKERRFFAAQFSRAEERHREQLFWDLLIGLLLVLVIVGQARFIFGGV